MGKRKKGKTAPPAYLPGATWQDVLAGKPTTADDRAALDRRKGRVPSRCESCRKVNVAKPGVPCSGCGGVLEVIA